MTWLALGGYLRVPGFARRRNLVLPLLTGIAYAVANLLIVSPVDPGAFYHVRYLLPSVPLLVVACVVGIVLLAASRPRWLARTLAGTFVAVGLAGAVILYPHESRRLHNDTRNINELQRTIGLWMAAHIPEDAWIATYDAGAVRYFSDRRTLDLVGLNTPDLRWKGAKWSKERPVVAVALMPALSWPVRPGVTRVLASFWTPRYTVTSNPRMGLQIVLGCVGTDSSPQRLDLEGIVRVSLFCMPWRPDRSM
ncbi:MAG: hypothetical protein D6689_11090 [Deltaproteobacteria bacterium]|nr:MAG: hypothetical protein D6689_11090 [Deltaproteobacteria bacterium]